MEGYGRVSRTILHHLNVVLLVLPRRGGASLTILLFSGLELSACVCVLGGGGITHPFLLSTDRQEKKIMWPCGHAGGRNYIYPTSPRHSRRKMF